MRSAGILSAVAALAATAVASDVLDLTAKTFKDTVNPEKLMLVEFFAPWSVAIGLLDVLDELLTRQTIGVDTARRSK